jgi:hypothetical protein
MSMKPWPYAALFDDQEQSGTEAMGFQLGVLVSGVEPDYTMGYALMRGFALYLHVHQSFFYT